MSSAPRPDDQRPAAPHDETLVDASATSSHSSTAKSSGASRSTHLHDSSRPVKTVEEFSANLTASGLMSAEEVKSFSDSLVARDAIQDAEAFAAKLIEANRLTPYQAETLRQGHTRGLVLGNYVILEKLGEGGMGMVFQARHRLMKRIVALKVLPPSMTQSPDAVNRFHREVEVAARLAHQHIAAAHDADQADGIHFLVMEYVNGPNLSALVKQNGPLSPPVAMNIVVQAARGLAHAHAHGVVHRDIKPGNLLVGSDGVVKILDMGLAQFQSREQNSEQQAELTQSGRIMGTVDYMAPEQALDAKSVDHRADIYSLGCTLYYLLAGRPVAPEGTLTQKLLWHQTDPAPSLKTIAHDVPDALDDLFQRMLAKQPSERPATMTEVVSRLEALLADIPPEQTLLPLSALASEKEPGSASNFTRGTGRMTMVDRDTRSHVDYADDRTQSVAPTAPKPTHPAVRSVLPLTAGLALCGIIAGVALFAYFGAPSTTRSQANRSGTAAANARLIIASTQPNARVFIDGKERGRTNGAEPYHLELALPAGKYAVRVEKDRFKPFEDRIELAIDKPLTLKAPLDQKPAVAEVTTDLAGVQVSVDGRPQGTVAGKGPYYLSVNLEPGEHTLRFETDGYEAKEERVKVSVGEKFEKAVHLAERPYREVLTFIFNRAHPSVQEPVILTDATGYRHKPRKWADVPASNYELREVNLAKANFANEELSMLARAELLDALSLADTKLDDSGARQLSSLKSLRRLDLRNTSVTDKGLASLRHLSGLRELDLSGTNISDVGLESLAELPLEELRVSGTPIGDAGIQHLAKVKTLKSLVVDGTRVTEDGYNRFGQHFAKHPIDKNDLDPELSLARRLLQGGATIRIVPQVATSANPVEISDALDLPSAPFYVTAIDADDSRAVDDSLIREFPGLKHLTAVDLDGSAVTEDGLAHLRQITSLRSVELGYLRVAKASVDSLRQALSDATVIWHGPRDRAVAEWIINHGGAVRLTSRGGKFARQLADLPENRDFRLEEIHLSAKPDLPPEELEIIKDLSDLRVLNLAGTKVTSDVLDRITGCSRVQTLAVSGRAIDSPSIAIIAARFPEVERLFLAESSLDSVGLQQLIALPNLRQLSLAGSDLDDDDLAALAGFTKLTWLSLDGTTISDDSIPHLLTLKSLKVLSLDDNRLTTTDQMIDSSLLPSAGERGPLRISDGGIEELHQGLKNTTIHSRELSRERLAARWVLEQGGKVVVGVKEQENVDEENVSVPSLAALPRQRCSVLEISLRQIPNLKLDALAAQLRECQQLRVLELSGNAGLQSRHLAGLARLKKLEVVNLARTSVDDSIFKELGELPKLRVLDLQAAQIKGSGFASHPLPNLTEVNLSTTEVDDAALEHLKESKELTVLNLSNCKWFTDRGLAHLAGLEKLENLDLSLTRVSDNSGATIGSFAQLKSLNLNGIQVTDRLLSQLEGLQQLEVLNLNSAKVTDAGIPQISNIKSLRRLSLSGTAVSDAAIAPLRQRGVTIVKPNDPSPRDPNGTGVPVGNQ